MTESARENNRSDNPQSLREQIERRLRELAAEPPIVWSSDEELGAEVARRLGLDPDDVVSVDGTTVTLRYGKPLCAIYNADGEKVRDLPVEATDQPNGYRFTEPFTLRRGETLWCAMPGLDHLVQVSGDPGSLGPPA